MRNFALIPVLVVSGSFACSDDVTSMDAAFLDASTADAVAVRDSGVPADAESRADGSLAKDASSPDAAPDLDASPLDASPLDAGPSDAEVQDAEDRADADTIPSDANVDAGRVEDASVPDLGVDAGTAPDAGAADSGPADAGAPDSGVRPDAGPDAGVGQLIAFSSQRGAGDYNVFTMKLDGTDVRQITSDPAIDLFPSFAPDGRIIFVSTRGGDLGLYAYDPATDQTTEFPTPGVIGPSSPSISPDGTIVAFEGRPNNTTAHEIYVMPAAGGTPVRLTRNQSIDAGPIWSPDGTKLYFVSDRTAAYEIWSMTLNGTQQTQVTTSAGILGKPTISADGTKLAWSRLTQDMMRSRIVVEEIATHTRITLTNEDDSEPAYDPLGRWMIFTSQRFGDPELMAWDLLNGAPAIRLTNEPALDGAASVSISH